MTKTTLLRPRSSQAMAERLRASAAADSTGNTLDTDAVAGWLAERSAAHHFRVDKIAFDELDGWSFAGETGTLGHRSGRFFTVEGLRVHVDGGPVPDWEQPIIRQPEVGILGLLMKEFDGVPHFLMQAKMEPGNRNLLQLSPTVQATRSNYTKVHQGADVKYLGYFVRPELGRVLVDVLQSEHGSWFYRKFNRNVIVEAVGDVPLEEGYCWLTLGQLGALLRRDNLVNMDARTVLACLPVQPAGGGVALRSDAELASWFAAERARHEVHAVPVPLAELGDWRRDAYTLARPDGRYFSLVAVSVEADNREVKRWTQPLFEPAGLGVTAFLVRHFGGVPHLLVSARAEAGFLDRVEIGPTVQCVPANWEHLPPSARPRFLTTVLGARPADVLYEAVHSEEGGRFLNAESRYLFLACDEEQAPTMPPEGFQWATPAQLNSLSSHSHYLNVQARTLLSCLTAGAAGLAWEPGYAAAGRS